MTDIQSNDGDVLDEVIRGVEENGGVDGSDDGERMVRNGQDGVARDVHENDEEQLTVASLTFAIQSSREHGHRLDASSLRANVLNGANAEDENDDHCREVIHGGERREKSSVTSRRGLTYRGNDRVIDERVTEREESDGDDRQYGSVGDSRACTQPTDASVCRTGTVAIDGDTGDEVRSEIVDYIDQVNAQSTED